LYEDTDKIWDDPGSVKEMFAGRNNIFADTACFGGQF
jgi:hypothetical protein